MLLRLLLGFLIFLFSAIGILVNLIVLQPVYKLSKNLNKSSVYLISFFNILTDLVNLSQSAFYLAPCIIFKSYIFGEKNDEGIPKLLGTLALVTWYIGNITQIVMATNRFVVICYLNNNIFTHRNIKILFGITLIFAITKAYIVQYITPCCAFVYDYQILSYNYARKPGIPNYSDISDLPLNAFATIVAFTCYILIIYKIHKSNKKVVHIVSSNAHKKRKNKEFIYAMQFFSISIFYTFAWVFLRVFPIFLGGGQHLEWFILIAFCVIINSSANAFIYLVSNKEIMDMLKNRRESVTNLGSSMERERKSHF